MPPPEEKEDEGEEEGEQPRQLTKPERQTLIEEFLARQRAQTQDEPQASAPVVPQDPLTRFKAFCAADQDFGEFYFKMSQGDPLTDEVLIMLSSYYETHPEDRDGLLQLFKLVHHFINFYCPDDDEEEYENPPSAEFREDGGDELLRELVNARAVFSGELFQILENFAIRELVPFDLAALVITIVSAFLQGIPADKNDVEEIIDFYKRLDTHDLRTLRSLPPVVLRKAHEVYTNHEGTLETFVKLADDCAGDRSNRKVEFLADACRLYLDDVPFTIENVVKMIEEFGVENMQVFLNLWEKRILRAENCDRFEREYLQKFPLCDFHYDVIERFIQSTDTEWMAYLQALEPVRQRLIASDGWGPRERGLPEAAWLVQTVFPRGNFGNYGMNMLNCSDRHEHLSQYQFQQEGYPTELSGLLGYTVKSGEMEDISLFQHYESRLQRMRDFIAARGPSNTELAKAFEKKIDDVYERRVHEKFRNLKTLSVEAKMLCLFITEIIERAEKKTRPPAEDILDLLILYKYAYVDNLEGYIRRSAAQVEPLRDEVSQRQALWTELDTIYGENLKHVLRHEFFDATFMASEEMKNILATYGEIFQMESEGREIPERQLERIRATFQNPHISDKASVLEKQILHIFGSNIRFSSEEEREAWKREIRDTLEEVSRAMSFESFLRVIPRLFAIRERYQFNLNGKLEELFLYDTHSIRRELAKYREEIEVEEKICKLAKKRKLRSFFMKTKESSNARMGAHLCIAGDTGMWGNENYFELVTKDEEAGRCRAVTMFLNIETPDGRRYLWFGPNPYESLLAQVSAKQCYDHLYGIAVEFAEKNGFDGVVVPEEARIIGECTNCTGEFPNLLKRSMLRKKNGELEEVDFGGEHTLSGGEYTYGYRKGILIWKRKT